MACESVRITGHDGAWNMLVQVKLQIPIPPLNVLLYRKANPPPAFARCVYGALPWDPLDRSAVVTCVHSNTSLVTRV